MQNPNLPPQGVPPTAPPAAPPTQSAPTEGGGKPRPVDDLHIDVLLDVIVDRNCSDLHIAVDSEPVVREDGALKRLNFEKFSAQQTQRMMYEIVSDDQIQRFESTLELDFSYSLPKVVLDSA